MGAGITTTFIPPELSDNEAAVLDVLSMGYGEYAYPFDYIGSIVKLDRDAVRYLCHTLRDKDLAYFARGLMTEEGMMAGSGYGITSQGMAAMGNRLDSKK